MNPLRRIFERTLGRFLGRLRFPQLFVLTAVVFLVNVAIPDVIPFVDEILLGLGSLILGSLKEKVGGEKEDRRTVENGGSRAIEETSPEEKTS